MKEKEDIDLDFLSKCSNEQLQFLCDILTKDEKGEFRGTEMMSITELYKKNYPQKMHNLLPLIKKEICDFGGNSFANFFREIGAPINLVTYRDVLEIVCDRARVNYNKGNSTILVERYLIQKTCITSIENMTVDDIFHISEQINKRSFGNVVNSIINVSGPAYRVIVPAVLTIVYLRYITKEKNELSDFLE